MGIVGLVCNDGQRGGVLEQDIGSLEVMRLPGGEKKACRVAQRIDRGMDLGAQAASAASEGLFVWIPPFAPALCWWARTMVASIIAYSLSASCAKVSNTRCHTPLLLQRECAYARRGNHQSARASPAKEYLRGSGRAQHPQTSGYHAQSLQAVLPGRATSA